jgi:hypothetical protein
MYQKVEIHWMVTRIYVIIIIRYGAKIFHSLRSARLIQLEKRVLFIVDFV